MAAVAIYKVRKPFMFEGVNRKIGEELTMDSREADKLIKSGLLLEGRFLDPDNADDAEKIQIVKDKMAGKKTGRAAEQEARDEDRNERLAEEDEKRKELVEKAKSLLPDDGENDVENIGKEFEKMTIPQLEATIADLEEKTKPADEGKDDKKSDNKTAGSTSNKTSDTGK